MFWLSVRSGLRYHPRPRLTCARMLDARDVTPILPNLHRAAA